MKKYLTLLLCSLCALAGFTASAASTAGLKDVNIAVSYTHLDVYKRQPMPHLPTAAVWYPAPFSTVASVWEFSMG